jgi:beta-barrel assembly-enhancing protease
MPRGFFYNLGKSAGRSLRKGRWYWESVVGSEGDAIEAEFAVGRDLAAAVRAEAGVDADPRPRKVLDDVTPKLVARVRDKRRRFAFDVIADASPNAFALPGGFIFISRSLVELCGWRADESAFVLAHEMAHVVKRHAIERVVNSSAVSFLSRAVPVAGALGGWVKQVGAGFLMKGYSQEQELEADAFGTRLIVAAGYDGGAAVRLLTRLRDVVSPDKPDLMSEYFSSHPPFDERIARVTALLG